MNLRRAWDVVGNLWTREVQRSMDNSDRLTTEEQQAINELVKLASFVLAISEQLEEDE